MARVLLWLALLAWGLLALAWGLLHLVIVPRIGDWRPELEQAASAALGIEVRIGGIEAESLSAIPTLTLLDVTLLDAQGREALRLPRLLGALSPRSLLSLGFEQLVIDSPRLDIRREADGRLTIAGIDVSKPGGSGEAADWLFSQREVLLRDGVLRWSDARRPQAQPLELREVRLLVRNPGKQHQLRLDATPPAGWGERFSVQGRFRQPLLSLRGAGDWRDWSGELHADFPALRLDDLRRHLDAELLRRLDLRAGSGALRLWAGLQRGRWSGLTADLALRRLALRLAPGLEPLALDDLSGRFELDRSDDGLEFATRRLAFRTGQGQVWPGGDLRWRQQLDAAGELASLRLQGERLDLVALRQLADRLPLPASGHDWLDRLQPAGLVERIDLQWRADSKLPQGLWQAGGRISGLALRAGQAADRELGRPGISGAQLDFDATQGGGSARLALDRGTLEFPGMFEEPALDFDSLRTDLSWKVDGERIAVDIPRLEFANADLRGSAQGRWQTVDPARSSSGRRFPGRLELDATLERANAARVHRYLPRALVEVRGYLREAVQRGHISDARARLRGDLWDFPFEKPGSGEFDVRARLSGVDFDYVPPRLRREGEAAWPTLQHVDAELRLDRASLRIGKGRAQVADAQQLRLDAVDASIANFMRDPLLQVQGKVAGPASDALGFVNRSPLLGLTGHALERARIDGGVQLQLQLQLPLERLAASRVDGQLQFGGNDLQITPDSPPLQATTGLLRFSEKGFSIAQARTRLLGGELAFQGSMTQPGGETLVQFKGQGSLSAEGLRDAGDWGGPLAAIGRRASGGTSYQAQLEFRGHGMGLQVSTDLKGLALALPAPLGKPAASALPLRYETGPLAGDGERDLLSLDIGTLLSARYERSHGAVLRGAVAIGAERPALPAQGVIARASFDEISIDDWIGALATPGKGQAKAADAEGYAPSAFALRARRIEHEGRSFHDISLSGAREQERWLGAIEARELKGRFEYTPASDASAGRIQARLERLSLQASAASEVEDLLLQAPTRMPALDISVQEFELGPRKLGRLEIEALNRVSSPARRDGREWRLNKLNLTVPEATLRASGNWALPGAQGTGLAAPARRTALNLRLEIADSGALLARFGMPGVVRGGKGTLEGNIGWLGSPMALHYPSLGGELAIEIERGQFLKAEPGLAKLLGVLSLQALPRRLTLDFRDIFSEGFAFDFVRGNARIAQGVISSSNLQMKGVNAAVLLEGSADLARETQDLQVLAIPELNAGTASLIATFIHPVTGIGTFIAQYLLGKPLQAAATQQFHISGSWYDPRVEKAERPRPTAQGDSR